MTRLRRLRSVSARLAKALIGLIAFVLVLLGLGLAVVETGWAKNLIRDLIVGQANQYLTATLSIGRLEGSLLRGITLGDVSVSRDGRTLIHIDDIALSYSIRELVQSGVVVRRVQLTRPRIVAGRQPDGRWDLAALVRRESREQERTGPSRPIEILSIEIIDGRISLRDPLDFGAAHVPTEFEALDARFAFAYFPVRWKLTFDHVSWVGRAPDLSVTRLAGVFGRGPGGWFFENFSVDTARSAFTLDGRINTERKPTELALRVRAPRFAFQEWAGVIRGLKNIAVESSFDTSLSGPVNKLLTDLRLAGTGGSVIGTLTLDTSVPGWHGAGAVDVERLNLALWLNRADRPSDITGHVTFNLALELGRHFPRGVYTFEGRHAMYMGYEADQVRARGQVTATTVLVASADAVAYGARVSTADSSIGIDSPFPFHFHGGVNGIDLRRVPATVPVPRVESTLTFNYDVSGRFSDPFIIGNATFARSQFLGATVGGGTVGSIDTSQRPIRYTGDGDVEGVNLQRFGEGLDVGWLQEPRYAGTVSGHFQVQGAGADRATLTLTGGGRLARAEMFSGTLSDADVTIGIDRGTLRASFDGRFTTIDPAIPFVDPRLASSLTGSGRVQAIVRDLLTRTIALPDYDIRGALALAPSVVRDVPVDSAAFDATLIDSTLTITRVETTGAALQGGGSGTVVFKDTTSTDFQYDLSRLDLAQVRALTGADVSGVVSTTGRVSGPADALHAVGDAKVNQLDAYGVRALTFVGRYDATLPASDPGRAKAQVSGRGAFLTLFGQSLLEASGTVTTDADRVGFDLQLLQQEGRNGRIAGHVRLREDRHTAELEDLTLTLGRSPWRLATMAQPPVVSWNDEGLSVTPVGFSNGNDERIGVSGTWRRDGEGALRITASHVFLDTLQSAFDRPTRYGGVLDLDATLRGTAERPRVAATLTVSNGRVERVSYQKLQGRVDYDAQMLRVDLRLDQAPGVWLTAVGTAPTGLFNRDLPDQPLDVAIKSSAINLGLIEGVTDVIRSVSGEVKLDVRAIGTSHDPHLDGSVEISNAAFQVSATGAAYKNGRAAVKLALERLTVETLHLEDNDGHALDVHGSLATHELHVGDLEIDARAQHFEVMRSELGQVDVDATLQVRGQFESPRIAGNLTIVSGNVKVDEILERTLFQPYSTEPTSISDIDAVAALNPWQRLGLDIELHVPNTLHLTGRDVQVSPGTPIGLGDINLRVAGDLYLYKDPGQPISVTGSFDSVSGTYTFQGRRFDVVATSSINFRGDLNPEIYVTVTRLISGVETRVSITGPMRQPELRLSSTPPLDDSDILSLIVFNTNSNQLSSAQQQELLVRAGTLAAGFITTPILHAIESQLGLEILDVEAPGAFETGPKVTIGQEIAPGLVARFSRQFGQDPYDEATIEYYLSRLLRLRATFSDAQTLSVRSPFRRIERAGIDLLLFFSF